ncbi:uncharacterized protein LOC105795648 [Gossypium raimondii]|uniref:uncharacterized protein LOC105795648 n=1 Tax=Gossypium raimondii TaxID=29730 RepID=UPI00227AFF39|nr:uncharacterized protein LOC105795648 [Gossypium raimondii]
MATARRSRVSCVERRGEAETCSWRPRLAAVRGCGSGAYARLLRVLVAGLGFQEVLRFCIDEAQSAFVPGRLTSDNIVAAYEILHSIKNRRFGKEGLFALKLDMSKAYNCIEWRLIEKMLLKMGFSVNWVERIMWFITSVTYSVVVNGRVGDKLAESSGAIKGARVMRGPLRVTHLLFSDDSLIFGDATAMKALNVLKVLQSYAKCSGQLVNFEKSRVFFSSNVDMRNQLDVERILGVHHADNWEKYLGLPCMVGRNKKWAFASLRDKIQSQISSWSARLLSMGSKEVFIKSIL